MTRPPAVLVGLFGLAAIAPLALAQPAASAPAESAAGDGARWYIQTSLATRHFHADPAHVNSQRLINIERIASDNTLIGIASFRNSFGQPSELVYVGKRWHPWEKYQEAHVKVVAGVLHGYKGEYRDKIPFNRHGIAPAVLPAIGWTYKNITSEAILFGWSGVLVTLGYTF